MKALIAMLLILVFSGVASAKDKVYEPGTVKVAVVKTGGWIDTVVCDGPEGYVRCDGGIEEDENVVYSLRMHDGTVVGIAAPQSVVELHHVMGSPDVLASACPKECAVKYRTEHHWGRPLLVFILMDNGKESKYYVEEVIAPPKAKQSPGLPP